MDLRQHFDAVGLYFLGVVTPEIGVDADRFETWLKDKPTWLLSYLEKYRDLRREPRKILEGAKSVILFALPYAQGDSLKDHGNIAQYARFSDYHKGMKKSAESVAEKILSSGSYRICVDTAPVLERALAQKVNGGFIGKNTCFIHEEAGSFLLLGEIFTRDEIPLEIAVRENKDYCGACTACQTVCPTGALKKDYQLESELCLAYWTIEHRGTIPEKFWPYLKDYYFGCDLCQLACPFNQGAKLSLPERIKRREFPGLYETATMDERTYLEKFSGTPLTRAGRSGLRRNSLIAMAVQNHPRLKEALDRGRNEPSVVGETVRQIETKQLSKG